MIRHWILNFFQWFSKQDPELVNLLLIGFENAYQILYGGISRWILAFTHVHVYCYALDLVYFPLTRFLHHRLQIFWNFDHPYLKPRLNKYFMNLIRFQGLTSIPSQA